MEFQFESFADFMQMAGHGPFVWLSYAVTVAGLVYLIVSPTLRRRRLVKLLKRQQRIEQAQNTMN